MLADSATKPSAMDAYRAAAILEALAAFLRDSWSLQVRAVIGVTEKADLTAGDYGSDETWIPGPCTDVEIEYETPDGTVDTHYLSGVTIADLVRGKVKVPDHELTWSIPVTEQPMAQAAVAETPLVYIVQHARDEDQVVIAVFDDPEAARKFADDFTACNPGQAWAETWERNKPFDGHRTHKLFVAQARLRDDQWSVDGPFEWDVDLTDLPGSISGELSTWRERSMFHAFATTPEEAMRNAHCEVNERIRSQIAENDAESVRIEAERGSP